MVELMTVAEKNRMLSQLDKAIGLCVSGWTRERVDQFAKYAHAYIDQLADNRLRELYAMEE